MRVTSAAALAALCAFGLLRPAPARAVQSDSAFSAVPSRFNTLDLSVASRALGEICYSREERPDGTICNAAFLPYKAESTLQARVFIGNGYTALNTADKFIFQPISKEFLQSMFRDQSVTSVEAALGLAFTTKYFSAEFSPYRVQYVSEFHNPNLPVVAVHASVERRLGFSGGVPLGLLSPKLSPFTAGLGLRLLQRKFVHGSFSMLEAVPADPRALLPVHEQNAVLLDPSLAARFQLRRWKLSTSVGLTNLGYTSSSSPLYPNWVDLHAGVGVEPPLRYGRLRLGLDLVNLVHADDALSRFRLGTSYQYGMIEVMTGLNSRSWTSGLQFVLQFIQAGVAYEFVRSDLYSLAGNGSAFESRISTEFGVRL